MKNEVDNATELMDRIAGNVVKEHQSNPTDLKKEEKTGFKCDCGSTKLIPTKNPKLFRCDGCKNYYIKKINPVVKEKKIQRNDKCYCGSGKKYKHCHLNK